MYFMYLIECSDKSIYTGITNDLERRFAEHKNKKGGHYTSSHKVEKIIYTENFQTKEEALKREAQIKGWRREKKLNLINNRINKKKGFLITGIPGTGKSTIIKNLQKKKLLAFDIEEIEGLCYWRDKKTSKKVQYHSGVGKDWLDTHEWVCDINKLKEIVGGQNETVIIGGITSNQNEYLPLFDKIFLLRCGRNTFINRLKARSRRDEYGKTVTERQMILDSYRAFEKDLIGRGAVPISTEDSIDEVIDKVISMVNDQA